MWKTEVLALVIAIGLQIHTAWSRQLSEYYTKTFRIPFSAFTGNDKLLYACSAIKLEPEQYVVEYDPLVKLNDIHHIAVNLCDELHDENALLWDCLDPAKICKGKKDAVYAWGNGATGWKFPSDAGIYMGNRSRYMIYQVHGRQSDEYKPGYAGMRVTFRRSRPKWEMSMLVTAAGGYVPAKTRDFTVDLACRWNHTMTVPIMFYSIHTHEYGNSVSGYIVRNGTWIEIGRGDPHYPMMWYDVTQKGLYIQEGDIIAARCTYDNNEEEKVEFGFSEAKEMCNFLISIGVHHGTPHSVRSTSCSSIAQEYKWEDQFTKIPSSASDTSGDTEQNRVVIKYGIKKVEI